MKNVSDANPVSTTRSVSRSPNICYLIATRLVAACVGSLSIAPAAGQFNPQDLAPDLYTESVETFANPHTNADCIGAGDPNHCCSGPGTGTCDEPVDSFFVVDCTTRNRDCTGPGSPFACCTGTQSGNCCYEEPDSANNFRGTSYCPASVCPDGCVNQWLDQSGHKSTQVGHPITGRTFEQDDLEKPCYKRDCINGHPCVVGHGQWFEPGYPAAEQPQQDATLEIEPADRSGPLQECTGSFYLSQLVRIVPQSEDHWLLAGFTKYLIDENVLQFHPFSGATDVSVAGVLPELDAWYFIELQRAADLTLTLWVNEENRTRSPVPSNGTATPWSTQNLCRGKTCDTIDGQEFQGEAALLFYRCGPILAPAEQAELRAYVRATFFESIFADGFESGVASAWSQHQP